MNLFYNTCIIWNQEYFLNFISFTIQVVTVYGYGNGNNDEQNMFNDVKGDFASLWGVWREKSKFPPYTY